MSSVTAKEHLPLHLSLWLGVAEACYLHCLHTFVGTSSLS